MATELGPDGAVSAREPATRLPAARRRRQLLDVAVDVFAANGFYGTSMDDVAEAAGVTKPVVYQHFSSKRQLFLELLDDVGSSLVEEVIAAVGHASGPHQQVEAGFGAYFRFVARRTGAFRVLFVGGARWDDDFADAVKKVEDVMAAAIAALIDAEIPAEHRRMVGYGIVGLAEVTSRHWVDAGGGSEGATAAETEQLARRVADLAWAGLRGVHVDGD